MDFFDKFEKICEIEHTTCSQVCKQIEMTNAALTMWRQRKNKPTKKTMSKLAAYFGIDSAYFTDDSITDPAPFLQEIHEAREDLKKAGFTEEDLHESMRAVGIDPDLPYTMMTEDGVPLVFDKGKLVDYYTFLRRLTKGMSEEYLTNILQYSCRQAEIFKEECEFYKENENEMENNK